MNEVVNNCIFDKYQECTGCMICMEDEDMEGD